MPRTTRRAFAKTLAVLPVAALAQTPPEPPPARNALGNALTGVVRAQSGQFLSAAELVQIDKDFQDYAPYLEKFREVPLSNIDPL